MLRNLVRTRGFQSVSALRAVFNNGQVRLYATEFKSFNNDKTGDSETPLRDFSVLPSLPKNLDILPRQKPDTASYFTGKAKLNDLYIALDRMIRRYERWIPRANNNNNNTNGKSTKARRSSWLSHESVKGLIGGKVTDVEYQTLLEKLDMCKRIRPPTAADQEEINWYLDQFHNGTAHTRVVDSIEEGEKTDALTTAEENKSKLVDAEKKKKKDPKKGLKDDLGRYYAIGHRKAASAQVWMVPVPGYDPKAANEASQAQVETQEAVSTEVTPESDRVIGEVMVNSKPIAEYFIRSYDRESALFPLEKTNQLGNYRVWATVRGGGPTGQCEAIALAISRALSVDESKEVRDILRKSGCLDRDPRSVERKKTGQPKARKHYTWVKR